MTAKPDDRSTLVDPRIADAWREATGEVPSASVDAAILAAARREVNAKPETVDLNEVREARAARRRWWPLAAAATVAAVAIGVLQVTPTDKLGAPAADTAIVSDVPAPAATPAPEIAPAAPSSKEDKRSRSDDGGVRSESTSTEKPRRITPSAPPPVAQPSAPQVATPVPPSMAPPPASPIAPSAAPPAATLVAPAEPRQQKSVAPAPAAAPDPFPAAPRVVAEPVPAPSGQVAASPPPPPAATANASRERDAQRREAAALAPVSEPEDSRAAARGSSAPAPLAKMAPGRAADSGVDEARAKDRSPLPVPEWIALIRRLRAEGKQTEAAKEIAAFRVAHADHEKLLPPDLRDWRPVEK